MFDEEDDEFLDGNFQEEVQRFEEMLEFGTSYFFDSDKLESIIDHFLIGNQLKKALRCVQHALEHFPANYIFRIRKAQILSAMGKLNEALHILLEVEKIAPNEQELLLTKASVYSQLRQTQQAIKYFERALVQSGGEEKDELYLDLAMEYQTANQLPEAIRVLKEAIQFNNDNESAVYELAFCYEQQGDFTMTVACYENYIDSHPYSFTAWYNLGNTFSKYDQLEKAAWAYEYSTLINENFASAYFNWGNTLVELEKYREAIASFEKCIEIDGEDGLVLNYIGEAYEQLEELELALRYYKRSIELSPELAEPWLGIGIVHDLMGNSVEAMNYIQKALQMEPENPSFWHVLGGCAEKNGEPELAIDSLRQALSLDASNEQILYDYTKLWAQFDLKSALNYLESYINEKQIDGIALIQLVRLNWLAGRQAQAIEVYSSLSILDIETAKTLYLHFPEAEFIPPLSAIYDQMNL